MNEFVGAFTIDNVSMHRALLSAQSTTGLDLEQLGVAVLEKEERMQLEKRGGEMNREATCGHIFP